MMHNTLGNLIIIRDILVNGIVNLGEKMND